MTERVCFPLQVRPERLDEYLQIHANVWSEMLQRLSQAGWRNYSLLLRELDGLVVGYLQTEDFAAALAAVDADEVNVRWQQLMAPYFAELAGARPDQGLIRLREYFHLA